ncbi:MAG: hypothetical protein DI564_05920 [Rhodanobacter denitrificans]|uniref:Uncharacterized protein n=1 Tax=Rhodanobacter denitrificans TaxID=666685 RepID=A0A2W5KJQ7_9GAMM|nr:MAG: hypothetical protein DI564_05920 [Rhodanobacter denitrificans]
MHTDDTYLARIKDEIRAEAEAARGRSPLPRREAPPAAPDPAAAADTPRVRTIPELSGAHHLDFLHGAFRAILKRPPDGPGELVQLRLLAAGASKVEILGNLRYSPEGREVGVEIPGLRPRYLLTKLFRVPVIGYLAEWLFALGGLPKLMHHLRASDTYNAARARDTAAAIDARFADHTRDIAEHQKLIEDQLDRLNRGSDDLRRVQTELAGFVDVAQRRFAAFDGALDAVRDLSGTRIQSQIDELRHHVLSMNHWLTSLRRTVAALEDADAQQPARTLAAAVAERRLGGDPLRPLRLAAWRDALAAAVAGGGRVLDLGSGADWQAALAAQNIAIDPADGGGLPSFLDDPATALARTGDGELAALSVLDGAAVLRRLSAAELFAAAQRVLRSGGVLLIAFTEGPVSIADRLDGRGGVDADPALFAQALEAAGFAEVRRCDAADGSPALLARRR